MVFKCIREFNLKLKPSKCSFFQMEIVYLAHHVSWEGICLSKENICIMEEFPMPKMYTEVRAFCGLTGHYRRFIRGFALIACPLYDVLGNEVKMGLVKLPVSVKHTVWELKEKIQSVPVLVFMDFDKPFLLRQTPLEKDWEQCSLRSKMMAVIILWHLVVTS